MYEFKKGDLVRVTKEICPTIPVKGKVGKIVKLPGDNYKREGYEVSFKDSPNTILLKDELKKLKENNMSKDFQPFYIEVEGPYHSRILQEVAFEEGFDDDPRSSIETRSRKWSELMFKDNGKLYGGPNESWKYKNHKLESPFTLEEFRQALRGEYNWKDPIEIGGYEVEFKDNSISVGCEEWSHDKVKSIYEALRIGDEVLNTSSTLHLRLSHPSVGEIPFEKIKAIYNRITD